MVAAGFCRYPHDNKVGISVNLASSVRRPVTDVCFHSWFGGGKTTWVPLDSITSHIVAVARSLGLSAVYLASDNQSPPFWEGVRSATRGSVKILPRIKWVNELVSSDYPPVKDNQIVSVLEQALAVKAKHFIGTVSSTWSEQVVADRQLAERRMPSEPKPNGWLADFAGLPGKPTGGLATGLP